MSTGILNFMPQFGSRLADGRKTQTYRKVEKYGFLKVGSIVTLRLNKSGLFDIGDARITAVEIGRLTPCFVSPFMICVQWGTTGGVSINRKDWEADGFDDLTDFIFTHHAFGNLTRDAAKPVVLRRLTFSLIDPEAAAERFNETYDAEKVTLF